MTASSDTLLGRVEGLLGRRITAVLDPPGRGYTPARCMVVQLDDGHRVFVKAATDPHIGEWLAAEIDLYRTLEAPFLPALVASSTEDLPVLVIEDLSPARWPPPWDDAMVAGVMDALDELHATAAPVAIAPLVEDEFRDGWSNVARDPGALLSTGLCDEAWLTNALPVLVQAEADAPLAGGALSHIDIRSDNLCQVESGEIKIIDWNMAARANPELDLVFWLPSLSAEGGPAPEDLASNADVRLVAVTAGYFAARAGLPRIPKAPRVREVQLSQLTTALPWVARCFGLPPPVPTGA